MSTENREGFNSSSLDVPAKEEVKKSEAHLTSAAAFVEGGIQEACEDACSICLEEFCESDPSTVTNCKHEFHLQCILEWCQRSSECPMCLQPIGLKDPTSQELLDAVEQERNFRVNTARNATIFHHPALGDFELPHLPVGASDAELEERIIQHLAAAAAMGRARHIARREGQRNRLSSHARPQFFVLSAQSNAPVTSPASSPPAQSDEDIPAPRITLAPPSSPSIVMGEESSELNTSVASGRAHPAADIASASSVISDNHRGSPVNNRRSPGQSSPSGQDRAGPSEFQSFSESLKSRFNSMSMRCKESISKSTRGWKEKFFSRNNSMADLGSEVRREVNAGIATVSRMMERLETRDNGKPDIASASNSSGDGSVQESNDQGLAGTSNNNSPHSTNERTSFAAGSGSS